MPEEESQSAESLYREYGKAERAKSNWEGELQEAQQDLKDAQVESSEVRDDAWSTPADETNADARVEDARQRIAQADEGVDRSSARYDASLANAKEHASDFVDEAKAEDEARERGEA